MLLPRTFEGILLWLESCFAEQTPLHTFVSGCLRKHSLSLFFEN